MKFANVELTQDTIQMTREWFAHNAQACIDEVLNGDVKVNDKESYFKWREEQIEEAMSGQYDHTLTFLQRAHHIQTGECVALLP
nr:hypothetical protein [Mycobacterium sp. E3298]